jgi:hypothetical protein
MWDVTPFIMVYGYKSFGETNYLHLQGAKITQSYDIIEIWYQNYTAAHPGTSCLSIHCSGNCELRKTKHRLKFRGSPSDALILQVFIIHNSCPSVCQSRPVSQKWRSVENTAKAEKKIYSTLRGSLWKTVNFDVLYRSIGGSIPGQFLLHSVLHDKAVRTVMTMFSQTRS